MADQLNSAVKRDNSNAPLEQALEMLSKALEDIRNIGVSAGSNVDTVVDGISEAITSLNSVDRHNLRDMPAVGEVNSAMDALRGVLGSLQLLFQNNKALVPVTQSIARTLAILYPLSKFGESKVPVHPAEKTPVPAHIIERRQARRMAIEAEVGFQSETNFFMGFSEDISTGGLFISTYDIRPMGSIMNINFTLPDGHLISVDGVVRWIREYNETTPDTPPGMGIQFDRLGPEDKEAIDMFIQERPALFYDDE